jgi:hypothetical protein
MEELQKQLVRIFGTDTVVSPAFNVEEDSNDEDIIT